MIAMPSAALTGGGDQTPPAPQRPMVDFCSGASFQSLNEGQFFNFFNFENFQFQLLNNSITKIVTNLMIKWPWKCIR